MNRTLLVLLGAVAALVMIAGAATMASALESHAEYQEPSRARPAAVADRHPLAQGPAAQQAEAKTQAPATKPYEEAEYRSLSRRRKPRGHLGGRAAAPAVRGLRPCRSHLRVHRRGDRLQDRRFAIRPARARVHEAPLRVLLAHRDLRSGPDVHAHHPVSEVHELPDERVLSHLSPVRPALLRGGLLPLHLLLRLGEVPSPGASWSGARPQRRRHGHHVDRQCLAHVHDVAARGLEHRGGALRLGRHLELHLDADQRPSRHRERRVRRIGRRRLRGLQVPAGDIRRGARALRLDGIHRQLRRDQRLPPAPLRRLLAREGDLRLSRRRSGSR